MSTLDRRAGGTVPRRARVCLMTASAVVATLLIAPGAAVADTADPAGTTVLASGPTSSPDHVFLGAATPTAVVVAQDDNELDAVDRTTGASRVITTDGDVISSAGNLVVYQDRATGRKRWYNAATRRVGAAPDTWFVAAPNGGVLVDQPSSGTTRIRVQSVAGAVTDLATVPFAGPSYDFRLTPSASGLLVSWSTGGGSPSYPAYLGYVPWSGGGLQAVDLAAVPSGDLTYFSCGAPSSAFVACSGGSDLFGAAPGGRAAVLASGVDAFYPAVTRTAVVWTEFLGDGAAQAEYLRSVPRGGGAVTTATSPVLGGGVLGDGSTAFVDLGTSPADAGIYSTPDAATPPTLVAALGAAVERADAVAVDAGRVLYADNRTPDRPAWQRSLSATPGGVTAGSEQLLATGASGFGLAVSGARSGYGFYPSRTFSVVSPLQPTWSMSSIYQTHLSGNRVIFEDGNTPDLDRALVDLNTGAYTSLTALDPAQTGSLWGDTFTFIASDGSLVRADLGSRAGPTTVLRPPASGSYYRHPQVWGDWVAVTVGSSTPPYGSRTLIYNTKTRAKRTIPGYIRYEGVTAAGYLTDDGTLVSWDGTHSITVPVADRFHGIDASATTLAWIDPQGVPKVAPIPWTTPNPPRSLGDPSAPATVASGGTWAFDLPTSAPLTSCSVDVLRGTVVVRTLPCDTTYTGGGDAVVRWDTRNTAGRAVPTGTYKWRVTASNADGPLQMTTGAAGTVSGTFTVTAAG